jgi:hypothetical protein
MATRAGNGGRLAAIVREILFYSPSGTLVGIAVGGLGATLGGLAYFLHLQNVIDARNLYRGLDSLEIKIKRHKGEAGDTVETVEVQECDDEEAVAIVPREAQPMYNLPVLNIPLPVLTVCFWTVSFLATSIFAYTRAKLRLQFK